MSKVQWIISNELGALSDIGEFVDKLKDNPDCIVEPVSLENVLTPTYKPSGTTNIPTIFYGPVNFINRMSLLDYRPGVYGSNEEYSYENLCKHIDKEYLFNSPDNCVLGNYEVILNNLEKYDDNDLLFFKPGDDSKFIIGQVSTVKDIKNVCYNIRDDKIPDTTKNSPLLLGTPYGIEKEYRLFVIDGKVITGSEYKPNISSNIPEQIIQFSDMIISKWCPFPLMILDLCISNGNIFVMEIQNFHSAGFYKSNLDMIINETNKVAIKYF